jgi:hypothetical protein
MLLAQGAQDDIVTITGSVYNSHDEKLTSSLLGDGLQNLQVAVTATVMAIRYPDGVTDCVSDCETDCNNNPGTCGFPYYDFCVDECSSGPHTYTDICTLNSSGDFTIYINFAGTGLLDLGETVRELISVKASLVKTNENRSITLSQDSHSANLKVVRAPDFITPGGLVRAFRRSVNINSSSADDLPMTPYPMVYLEGNDPQDKFNSDGYLWVMSKSCLDLADGVTEPINDGEPHETCFSTKYPALGKCCDVSLADYFFSNGYTVWFLMTEYEAKESRMGTASHFTDGVDYQYMWAVKEIIQRHETAFPDLFRGIIVGGFSGGATSTVIALSRWCAGEWDNASKTNYVNDGILPTSWCTDNTKIAGWYAGDGGHKGAQATAAMLRVLHDPKVVETMEDAGTDVGMYQVYVSTPVAYEWLVYSVKDETCTTGCHEGDCSSLDSSFSSGCDLYTSKHIEYMNFASNSWPRRGTSSSSPVMSGVLWSNGGPPGGTVNSYNEKMVNIHTRIYIPWWTPFTLVILPQIGPTTVGVSAAAAIACGFTECCSQITSKDIDIYLNSAGGNGYGGGDLVVPNAFGEHVNGSIFSQVKDLHQDDYSGCARQFHFLSIDVFSKSLTTLYTYFPFMATQTALNCSKDNCLTDPNGGPQLATDYTYNTTGQLMDHMAPFSHAASKILAGFMHEQLKGNKSSSPICSAFRDVGMKAECRVGVAEIPGNNIDDNGNECVDEDPVTGECLPAYNGDDDPPEDTAGDKHRTCCVVYCADDCHDNPTGMPWFADNYSHCMQLCGEHFCSDTFGSCSPYGDMGYCGDTSCPMGENCHWCPADCGNCCNNGTCEREWGESHYSCPQDCPCYFADDCDDDEQCTSDSCNTGVCINTNTSGPCDDSVYCNGEDTCSGGSCSQNAGDPCSDNVDSPYCNETEQRCDQCLQDSHCDDTNVCTYEYCNTNIGICIYENNEEPCEDPFWCNGQLDSCSGGTCSVHSGDPCFYAPGTTCNEDFDRCDECLDDGDCAGSIQCDEGQCGDCACSTDPSLEDECPGICASSNNCEFSKTCIQSECICNCIDMTCPAAPPNPSPPPPTCDNDDTCDTGAGEDCSTCAHDCGICGSGGCDGSHCGFTFCSASCPCTYGQADCDSDADCVENLVCGWQAGEDFGCASADQVDACVPIGEATGGYCGDDTCDNVVDEDEDENNCPVDCSTTCTPDCSGRVCGPDPNCGESCGTCTGGQTCNDGVCEDPPSGGGDIGYTTVFSQTSSATDRRAQQVTADSAGDLQSITIYHNGGSGGMLLAVYADNSGAPGTRLGVTQEVQISSSAGWETANLTSPVSITAGQKVWLAWVFENFPGVRADDGTPGRASSGVGWSGDMPSDFGSASISDYIYSIYTTYSGGGGCTPDCGTRVCGPDPICGESCGTCSGGQVCNDGVCEDPPASGCNVISGGGLFEGDTSTGHSDD